MPAAADHRDRGSGWFIFARIMAAIPLNYALTALSTACLARLLPMRPDQASITATLVSFATFAVLVLVAFGARSIMRVWAIMIAASLLLSAILWISITIGGRL
jgi:hypothetical protein